MEVNPVSKSQSEALPPSSPKEMPFVMTAKKTHQLIVDLKKNWGNLAPEELAEQIIDLEGLAKSTPSLRKEVEHLHFKFVFPIALELETAPVESSLPISFARQIYKTANEMLKKNSSKPFQELDKTQQREILRQAMKGGK